MLKLTLLSVLGLATCSDFKFRLSNGDQVQSGIAIKYKAGSVTWMSHAFMDHDNLPSFEEYWKRINPSIDTIPASINHTACRRLDKLRSKVVTSFINTKRAPRVQSDHDDLKKSIRSTLRSRYADFPEFASIVDSFVFPKVSFWAASDDMDSVEPLITVTFKGELIDQYISDLIHVNSELQCAFRRCYGGTNAFGLDEIWQWIWFDCFLDIHEAPHFEISGLEIIKGATKLDMNRRYDESIQELYTFEEKMRIANINAHSKRIIVLKSKNGVQSLALPTKKSHEYCYFSVVQLFHELRNLIKGPIEYVPKSEKFANNVNIVLPPEVVNIIAAMVSDQPYISARLVCKSFYLLFNKSPRQPSHWPAFVVSSRVANFFIASVMSEVQKDKPDYTGFPKRLIQSVWSELALNFFDKLTIPTAALIKCPNGEGKWTLMHKSLQKEYSSILSSLESIKTANEQLDPYFASFVVVNQF